MRLHQGRSPINAEKMLLNNNADDYTIYTAEAADNESGSENDVVETNRSATLYLHVASKDNEIAVSGEVVTIELEGKCEASEYIFEGERIEYGGRKYELVQKKEIVDGELYDLYFTSVYESAIEAPTPTNGGGGDDDGDITFG